MKKMLLILVLVMSVSMGMAYAEDRLTLYGQVRVWAFMTENYWDLDNDVTADEMSWFEQRFRLGAKLNVMEGVTANLRFDFSEDYWGSDTWGGTTTYPANDGISRYGGNRNTGGNELQVDRAYIEVNKENYMFRVGQIYQGLGNGIVVDQNRTGLTVQAKLPVTVDVMYAKLSEGQNGSKNDDGTEQDSDFFAVNARFKKDTMTINAFVAAIINQTNMDDDDTPLVVGVQGKTDLNGIKLNCELDFFTGEQSADVDYVGTQLFVDASTMVGDHKIGAMLFYAMGTDKDDEIQIDYLTDFSTFAPLGYGFMDTIDWDPVNDGAGVASNSTFRACGPNAGIMALAAYGDAKLMEKLILRSMLAYAAPSEDDVAMLDSLILFNLGLEYQMFKNLSLFVAGNYAVGDPKASGAPDDPAMALAGSVRLNF